MSEWKTDYRWAINEETNEIVRTPIGVIDFGSLDRESNCGTCTTVEAFGIDACCGCAG